MYNKNTGLRLENRELKEKLKRANNDRDVWKQRLKEASTFKSNEERNLRLELEALEATLKEADSHRDLLKHHLQEAMAELKRIDPSLRGGLERAPVLERSAPVTRSNVGFILAHGPSGTGKNVLFRRIPHGGNDLTSNASAEL